MVGTVAMRGGGGHVRVQFKPGVRFMAEKGGLSGDRMKAYWLKTSTLMWIIMALWFVFSFGVHLFAPSLNKIKVIGFPLGFYMAAQGSLIAFVALCFWNSYGQNKIDEEFGVSDE
jgi:putative solute:sodium symporter small subunit